MLASVTLKMTTNEIIAGLTVGSLKRLIGFLKLQMSLEFHISLMFPTCLLFKSMDILFMKDGDIVWIGVVSDTMLTAV